MAVQLNTFEMFEIAEQIEQNGAEFYNKASEICNNSNVCRLFLRLAEWERKHKQVFMRMRLKLSEPTESPRKFNPEDKLPVPKAMAGLAVFGLRPEPTEELNGTESEEEVLRRAIEKEEDSIIFYNGLMDFLPFRADKDKLDGVIQEEMRHIRILNRLRNRRI